MEFRFLVLSIVIYNRLEKRSIEVKNPIIALVIFTSLANIVMTIIKMFSANYTGNIIQSIINMVLGIAILIIYVKIIIDYFENSDRAKYTLT